MPLRAQALSNLLALLSRAALPAICLLVAGYFGSHAIFGSTGILARESVRARQAELAETHAELAARKAKLEQKIALLDPEAVDPDYADELVRRHLGVVRPDEVVIPIGPSDR